MKPEYSLEGTDAKAEAPVFWTSDEKRWLTGKVPDAGEDWGLKEKRVSEDEMAGWHHRCNEHEFGQTLGDSERQEGVACCSPWGCKELDMTRWLNNNNKARRMINTGKCGYHKVKSPLSSNAWQVIAGKTHTYTHSHIPSLFEQRIPIIFDAFHTNSTGCCCSVAQSHPTLCNPMDCSTPGLPVPVHLPKFAQIHVHCIGDAIQPSHSLMPSSPALNLSQH